MMRKQVVELQGAFNKRDAIRQQTRLQRYQQWIHNMKRMGRRQGK